VSVIVLLIIAGGSVAAGFLAAFAWAVRSGQYDDTATPPVRMLADAPSASGTAPRPPHKVSVHE
jgi:cbb3-type cytochrome oxidase maturation protein